MPRLRRHLLAALVSIVCLGPVVTSCSGENPYQAAAHATTTTPVAGNNDYLPNRNLGDCVGTLEKPNCGSPSKGGRGMYLTFAALILGMGFLGWRITVGVRARDRVVNAED
jgi:hypothetical protein